MSDKDNTKDKSKSTTGDKDKTIFRVCKNKHNPYVQINKTILNDKRVSWKAKGLHCYMLSMPDDWVFHRSELIKHASDGRDSLNSAIRELEKFGYANVTKTRDAKGRINGWVTTIYESPAAPVIPIGLSRNGFSTSGEPSCGEPAPTKNECTKNDFIKNHYDPNEIKKRERTEPPKRTGKARIDALSFDEKLTFEKLKALKGIYVPVALWITENYSLGDINNVLEAAFRQSVNNPGAYVVKSLYKK